MRAVSYRLGMGFEATFTAELWRWQSRTDTWTFVSLPAEESAEIASMPREPRGFGAVAVRVRIGTATWSTSVFPDSSGRYVLPVKAAVRRAQGVDVGDVVEVTVTLV